MPIWEHVFVATTLIADNCRPTCWWLSSRYVWLVKSGFFEFFRRVLCCDWYVSRVHVYFVIWNANTMIFVMFCQQNDICHVLHKKKISPYCSMKCTNSQILHKFTNSQSNMGNFAVQLTEIRQTCILIREIAGNDSEIGQTRLHLVAALDVDVLQS